jgi:hypothetical protein
MSDICFRALILATSENAVHRVFAKRLPAIYRRFNDLHRYKTFRAHQNEQELKESFDSNGVI